MEHTGSALKYANAPIRDYLYYITKSCVSIWAWHLLSCPGDHILPFCHKFLKSKKHPHRQKLAFADMGIIYLYSFLDQFGELQRLTYISIYLELAYRECSNRVKLATD